MSGERGATDGWIRVRLHEQQQPLGNERKRVDVVASTDSFSLYISRMGRDRRGDHKRFRGVVPGERRE